MKHIDIQSNSELDLYKKQREKFSRFVLPNHDNGIFLPQKQMPTKSSSKGTGGQTNKKCIFIMTQNLFGQTTSLDGADIFFRLPVGISSGFLISNRSPTPFPK